MTRYFVCIVAAPYNDVACKCVLERCASENIYALFKKAEKARLQEISQGDIVILNCKKTFVAWGKAKDKAQDENTTENGITFICKVEVEKWNWYSAAYKYNGIDAKNVKIKEMMKPGVSQRYVVKELIPDKAQKLCDEIRRI